MPRKLWLAQVLVFCAVLGALGIATLRVTLFPSTERLSQADLQPRLPIENPFHVLISCEVHKQTGEAVYGDDAPVFALFEGCKPKGNFYLVAAPSTPAETCETRNQPEVAFQPTKSGEVKNIALTRGSGNLSVDRKVLQMVRDSRYPATNCGACAVFARVPVSLNCRYISISLIEPGKRQMKSARDDAWYQNSSCGLRNIAGNGPLTVPCYK